ncbi:cytochrome c-type biogenesis CcmH-like mitochondrial protein isoform X2 [Mangifera indica]|uniref:cytochrome c-type biogenesis CcmH-like mitochondrial protein isoform X2 n=1 Tax=Mangifera indica TaxID=29780 RepID=UPI001CFC0ABE|nr:cytochrome c-type biogenesis CcmH-like mitochondrial protein isoform X2 [Mangifera indica]XP_044491514.1 cytochrome c-type biogenesis CcmH-like mitochondrial protein isoform X2 [Mangifera indica]XP_044491516.1 cytochrome c-type biogenesis CcmH-like mitochondrial protein isoform X2 [Mangifera indica]
MYGAPIVEVNPSKIHKQILQFSSGNALITFTTILPLIRDEIQVGKTDKEVYKKLEDDYGETVLYTPKFDLQTAALWLSPLLVAGAAAGIWAYNKHKQKTNMRIMALNLVRGVPLTAKEKETMLDLLTPPPPEGASSSSWWSRLRRHDV